MSDNALLTDDDRLRIRQETWFRAEVRREVEAALVEKLGLFGKLNSRVALTALSGLFLSIITTSTAHLWQREHARDDAERMVMEKKVGILTAISNELDTSLDVMGTLQNKRIWLGTHRNADDVDELGRTRKEVEQEFWETWRMYMQMRKPAALLTEARLFFRTPRVQDAVAKADDAIEQEHSLTDEKALPAKRREMDAAIKQLMNAMRDEVQGDSRR